MNMDRGALMPGNSPSDAATSPLDGAAATAASAEEYLATLEPLTACRPPAKALLVSRSRLPKTQPAWQVALCRWFRRQYPHGACEHTCMHITQF